MRETIKKHLEDNTSFRERRNKNKGIAELVAKKYGIYIPEDQKADFVTDIMNADRYWRMELSENPAVRGSDWKTKDEMEQKKVMELGYEGNFRGNIKKLKTLF